MFDGLKANLKVASTIVHNAVEMITVGGWESFTTSFAPITSSPHWERIRLDGKVMY